MMSRRNSIGLHIKLTFEHCAVLLRLKGATEGATSSNQRMERIMVMGTALLKLRGPYG
jgi:hypothetical protein